MGIDFQTTALNIQVIIIGLPASCITASKH